MHIFTFCSDVSEDRSKNIQDPLLEGVFRVPGLLMGQIWVIFPLGSKTLLKATIPEPVEISTFHNFTYGTCRGHSAAARRETFKISVKHVVHTRNEGHIWHFGCFCWLRRKMQDKSTIQTTIIR